MSENFFTGPLTSRNSDFVSCNFNQSIDKNDITSEIVNINFDFVINVIM